MASVLKVSDAASIGLHAMVLLAANGHRLLSNADIAAALGVSEAHLSKVLQRLTHAGLTESTRGPAGGFRLANRNGHTSLLAVYEAIEGPLKPNNCLLSTRICGGRNCIFGGLLKDLDKQVRSYLGKTKLSALTKAFRSRK